MNGILFMYSMSSLCYWLTMIIITSKIHMQHNLKCSVLKNKGHTSMYNTEVFLVAVPLTFYLCSLSRFSPDSVAGPCPEQFVSAGPGHQPQHPLRDSEGETEWPLDPSSQWPSLQHGLQPATSAGLRSLKVTVELECLEYSTSYIQYAVWDNLCLV